MFYRLSSLIRHYPRQFWYQILGMLVSTTGMGMIWPFLTIYLGDRLGLPLSTVTLLLTLDSIMSIISSFVAGPISDRYGRKWVMVLSLGMMGLVYLLMSQATSLPVFALLMALRGIFVPLYRIGGDAMVADLIPEHERVEAYSISRMVNNVGVALGPSMGGFVAAASYTAAFAGAAGGLFFFSLFVAFLMKETLPPRQPGQPVPSLLRSGYGSVLRDRFFLFFVLAFTCTGMASSLVFVLLSTYTKENFGIPENLNGFIMAVNAVVVVVTQVAVTRTTSRRPPLIMMALGALLYGLGVGSIAFGSTFLHFALSMVVVTLGEVVLVPTSTTYAANLAPADMRARYMSIYSLGWGVSHGFGPVVGGLLNDHVAPVAIWYGGLAWALLSMSIFLVLWRVRKQKEQAAAVSTPAAQN